MKKLVLLFLVSGLAQSQSLIKKYLKWNTFEAGHLKIQRDNGNVENVFTFSPLSIGAGTDLGLSWGNDDIALLSGELDVALKAIDLSGVETATKHLDWKVHAKASILANLHSSLKLGYVRYLSFDESIKTKNGYRLRFQWSPIIWENSEITSGYIFVDLEGYESLVPSLFTVGTKGYF